MSSSSCPPIWFQMQKELDIIAQLNERKGKWGKKTPVTVTNNWQFGVETRTQEIRCLVNPKLSKLYANS